MNQVHENINKDMIDSDLIDVESLHYSDDQTWLYKVPNDSGDKVDIIDWNLSCDWPDIEEDEYLKEEKTLYSILDNILKNELSLPDKNKFDSRTFVRPKKRVQRPSLHNFVEATSNPSSIALNTSRNDKFLTYNKYNNPLGQMSPMIRLKTFNVDTNSENSGAIKEYAMKRRSLLQEDDAQLDDFDLTLASDLSERLSSEHLPSKPINIDLSQPAHNLHNTFNKGFGNVMNERGSMNMFQSGESLMRMSPPSLVSSLMMESSGNFNADSMDARRSIIKSKDEGHPQAPRDSIDPMMTSMTLSILDEKDMSTSFLSQTTYPDNDSLMDSLPPSLVSSVNSSYIVSNPKPRQDSEQNIFSSTTFTNLELSDKLLTGRPRCPPYNSFAKRESLRNSESYTKSREEGCQIDPVKILNENCDNKDIKKSNEQMSETITLHYANNKFKKANHAEKENLNSTFEKDDAFYNDMGLQRAVDIGKNSLNVIMPKQEMNEIIQARQRLSQVRKGISELEQKSLPPQLDASPIKTIQLPNKVITVPRQSMENASELLSRRRGINYDREEPTRETPKRNATFKKLSPKASAMDTTIVYVKSNDDQIIDINSATSNLIGSNDRTLQQEEWGSQERAMVGSSESTDTGTFSSSSPPESVPDSAPCDPRAQVASTPLMSLRKGAKADLLNLHSTISPIYDMVDDKSYTVTKIHSDSSNEKTYDMNTTVVNSATMVKKSSVKRDILAKYSPDKAQNNVTKTRVSPTSTVSYTAMPPPTAVFPRKTSLPTSKLRQYSSHKELNRIPGPAYPSAAPKSTVGRTMVRRNVYASNPVLSPTSRPEGYLVAQIQREEERQKPAPAPPPALVRQGTETLRRERPVSQLVAPKDPPAPSRPYSIAGASQLRVSRPSSVPMQRPPPGTVSTMAPSEARPVSSEARASALPRPSRLPAPRRGLRPPSVYSVAPTADVDHY